MEAQGESHLERKLGEKNFEHPVVVASIEEEVIFGLDFMQENRTKLDLGSTASREEERSVVENRREMIASKYQRRKP